MPDFSSLDAIIDRLERKRDRARKLSILFHLISWPGLIALAYYFGVH